MMGNTEIIPDQRLTLVPCLYEALGSSGQFENQRSTFRYKL